MSIARPPCAALGGRLPGRVLRLVSVLGIATCSGAVAAAAQDAEPLVTDRPDQTESTGVVPPGFVQLELGWTMSEGSDGPAAIRTHTLPEALARVGVLPRLEIRIALPVWSSVETGSGGTDQGADGFGDLGLGLKWGLVRERGAAPGVALLAGVTLPTGEAEFGGRRVDPSLRVAFSRALAGRLSIGWNLGWARVSERVAGPAGDGFVTDTGTDLLYTGSLAIGLTARLGLFLESFGFVGVEEARPSRHSLNGGFTLLLADNLQLDLRAGAGLDRHADDRFLGAGLSVRLPR